MTPPAALIDWCKGNTAAVDFCQALWDATQKWDDLEDEGKTDHNALCAWLTFGKEYDPFFMAYGHILRPAMLTMYLSWLAANELEAAKDRSDCDKAYMLRAGVLQVFHVVAYCIGGHDWAREVGPKIYREYGETPDGLWAEISDG